MRDLKFRVWHKKINMMLDVWKLNYDGSCEVFNQEVFDDGYCGQPTNESGTHDCFSKKSGSPGYISAKNCIILQYTGRKDEKDQEIYEGDIIEEFRISSGFPEGRKIKRIIEWSDKLILDDSYGENAIGFNLFGGRIEKIGNIYENPELLK